MSKAQLELVSGRVAKPRLPQKFEAAMAQAKPMFASWLKAETAFIQNTEVVARTIRHAFDLYSKSHTGGRVGFARLFDATIPEEAKTRDLGDNRTYNRLNYLIDKVGKPAPEVDPDAPPRMSVTDRRAAMHAAWLSWRRKHATKPIPISEVESLLRNLLAELWTEEAADEVLAA